MVRHPMYTSLMVVTASIRPASPIVAGHAAGARHRVLLIRHGPRFGCFATILGQAGYLEVEQSLEPGVRRAPADD